MDRYKRYAAMSGCGCNNTGAPRAKGSYGYDNTVHLAMPIMPVQEFRDLYSPCQALEKGTLFAELYKPYCIRGGYR